MSADDMALDSLLFAAEEAVLDKLDAAVDLDEGRARIFAASLTPDQEPIPHFLRKPAEPSPTAQPPMPHVARQQFVSEARSGSPANQEGVSATARSHAVAQHDQASDGDVNAARAH
ncbi:hypothetical protein PUR57_07570 [Streptomyces sp. JV176]|uniref:hypothetical protein n=1 Tax=Streptomyces sp. JV176 TaxID=858630 RepID=UPI002E76BD34|nr:hypothetical protein [Streptomyces sp. JV176]MEE1798536.1 hypothetical protein [Streptomyces sp. JV176]